MSALEELEAKYGKLGQWSDLPEGWKGLLDKLLAGLAETPGWSTDRVTQVKEKYAGLRFYTIGDETEEQQQLIETAERESLYTCMECGQPGVRRGKGWFFVSCEAHKGEL